MWLRVIWVVNDPFKALFHVTPNAKIAPWQCPIYLSIFGSQEALEKLSELKKKNEDIFYIFNQIQGTMYIDCISGIAIFPWSIT